MKVGSLPCPSPRLRPLALSLSPHVPTFFELLKDLRYLLKNGPYTILENLQYRRRSPHYVCNKSSNPVDPCCQSTILANVADRLKEFPSLLNPKYQHRHFPCLTHACNHLQTCISELIAHNERGYHSNLKHVSCLYYSYLSTNIQNRTFPIPITMQAAPF